MKRTANAKWNGSLKEGDGRLDMQSGAFAAQPYTFKGRFVDESGRSGTNPEELIAAAHAGCFSMALSNVLAKAGTTAERLNTSATVTFSTSGGAHIAGIALTVEGTVPGVSAEDFEKAANTAKENCPVSKALNVPITLEATLAS